MKTCGCLRLMRFLSAKVHRISESLWKRICINAQVQQTHMTGAAIFWLW